MPSDKSTTRPMQTKHTINDEKDKNLFYPNAIVSVTKHRGPEQNTYKR